MEKPCFSCNSAGIIDYSQALSQIEFWTEKQRISPSKINEATVDIWTEIAESLQINRKEFDTLNAAITYFQQHYDNENIENTLHDLSDFCDVHDISIIIMPDDKLIINE